MRPYAPEIPNWKPAPQRRSHGLRNALITAVVLAVVVLVLLFAYSLPRDQGHNPGPAFSPVIPTTYGAPGPRGGTQL